VGFIGLSQWQTLKLKDSLLFLHVKSTPKHQKYIDENASLIEDL